MTFITETVEKKASVLIITEREDRFTALLKLELKKYHADIFLTPYLPKNLLRFDYFFLIDKQKISQNILDLKNKKIIFIFQNKNKETQSILKKVNSRNVKVINVQGGTLTKEQIDKILWFSFSETKENYLQLFALQNKEIKKKVISSDLYRPNKKKLILGFFLSIFILQILFVFPLILSSFLFFKSVENFKKENFDKAEYYSNIAEPFLKISKGLYTFSRPTLLFFSLALTSDNIIDINEKTADTTRQLLVLQENGKKIIKLIMNKNKTKDDFDELSLRLNQLKANINSINNNLNLINQKLPAYSFFDNVKNELSSSSGLISNVNKILPFADSILAKNTEKKYLLLFANNMELRPGGGFIGSFGILIMKNYTLEDLKVYDVYDADGQLTSHIEPPEPIRNYLQQPNWFLRDSAFSPDFLENYVEAKNFLSREMNINDFSGAVLITTTAVQNILDAFGNIYLPDFNEKVNRDNFYLKAQIYAEKDFFPGSIKKKNFLGNLIQYMLIDLENISLKKFAKGLKKSLDEKQIVLYFDDSDFQKYIDSMYWSGRLITPACPINKDNCLSDFIFPFDANLGVDKANFFLSRTFELRIKLEENGKINHTFIAQFNNDSPSIAFPGGDYKNYFQIYLPKDAEIKKITKNGSLVEDFNERNDLFKKIGLFMEVKPKSITEIKINYDLRNEFTAGKAIYQLITQKQIGSSNSDFSFSMSIPVNMNYVNKNFAALVKDNQIVYNTSLSTDKIFFIELTKK